MAREVTGFRDYLMVLNERFPDKELLNKKEICSFLGIHRDTVRKHFPQIYDRPFVTKTDLARILARCSVV